MTNEEKARELAHDYFKRGQLGLVSPDSESGGYDCAMKMAIWNVQEENDIFDSVKGWDYYRYVCIMKDGKLCEWSGIQDEDYEGNINIHINPVNDDDYVMDDILYWTELKSVCK